MIKPKDLPETCPCCSATRIYKYITSERIPGSLWEITSHTVKYDCGAKIRVGYADIIARDEPLTLDPRDTPRKIRKYVLSWCPKEEPSKLEIWSKDNERDNL